MKIKQSKAWFASPGFLHPCASWIPALSVLCGVSATSLVSHYVFRDRGQLLAFVCFYPCIQLSALHVEAVLKWLVNE